MRAAPLVTLMLALAAVVGDAGRSGVPSSESAPDDRAVGTPQTQTVPSALARCESLVRTRFQGDTVKLVRVFESSAAEVAVWHETGMFDGGSRAGPGQSPMRAHRPTESISSCYFDGHFTFRWPLPQGATPPVFERMLLLVDEAGFIVHELGGSKNTLRLRRPAA